MKIFKLKILSPDVVALVAFCVGMSPNNTRHTMSVAGFLYQNKQPFVALSIPMPSLPMRACVVFAPSGFGNQR